MGRTRTRYTEPEVLKILRDRESNQLSVRAICVKYGITSSTYYRWRARHDASAKSSVEAWASDLSAGPRTLPLSSETSAVSPVPSLA